MSKFQLALTAVFVICIIGGVVAFATYKSSSTDNALPPISIWGSFPAITFNDYIQKLNLTLATPIAIQYTEISQSNFRQNFIEALANGGGPDAILIRQDDITGFMDKILVIPNTVITQRDFQDTYVPQADLYLTSNGTLAIPFIVDPMVMYWNKTMFTNAGIAKYPQYWDEFTDISKKINQKDANSNIRRSALALGEFANIDNAREILSALFLQAGNPVTYYSNGVLRSAIGDGDYYGTRSSTPAVSFFVQFANPRSTAYSWNRSLPSSKNSFLSGTLATYFGFTSEIRDLRAKNPNIDFDIAKLPQTKKGSIRATFGNMYGLSMVRSTTNANNTFSVLSIITQPGASSILSNLSYLPSARRDIIAAGSVDPYMSIFLDSALISKGWLDTNSNRSNQIFTRLVESITSGRLDTNSALKQASDELNVSLQTK